MKFFILSIVILVSSYIAFSAYTDADIFLRMAASMAVSLPILLRARKERGMK